MKALWSKHWKGSSKPRKQRKYQLNAPLHILRKMLSAPLSQDLFTKYKKRNVPVRKGDTVKVLRGQFKGKTGKIEKVYTKDQRVQVEGVTLTKKNGTKTPYRLHPSKVMITELVTEDKERVQLLERK